MEVSIGKSSIISIFFGFSISTFDYRQARLCMFVFTVDLMGGMKYVKSINISSEWTHLQKKTCLEKKTCWYPLGIHSAICPSLSWRA
jgi:hypothetical protein